MAVEEPLDEVDLRLRERRVEPDAAHAGRRAARPPRRRGSASRGEVRVVEDDASHARRELVVERLGEVAKRAAALVAVEPDVAAADEPSATWSCRRRGCPSRARPPSPRPRPSGVRASGRCARTPTERLELPARRARAVPRARRSGRSPVVRAPGIATRAARARAARRGRPRPGVASLRGRDRAERLVSGEAAGARGGPPSGECAITASPRSSQRSTTPPRRARSSNGAQRDLRRRRSARARAPRRAGRALRSRRRRGGRGPRRRAVRGRAASSATACAGPARGRGRGRSEGRRAPTRLASQSARSRDARPSGSQRPPSRAMPPFVTIRAVAAPERRSARARRRSL